MKFNEMLEELISLLGKENIITKSNELEYYQNTTFKTDNIILAIAKPLNSEEVRKCVLLANKHKVPLYPISKGNNWGYGSRSPSVDNCIILSLERLNNIIEHNEELAYLTVEPGVTFQMVYDYIEKNNLNLLAPSIGSTKNASLIGNAIDRGVGKGPYGDRFLHCCNMEVVLPDGNIIRTGYGDVNNAHSKNIFRWGVGPSLDGLFSQSNFGIVTKMTFWLSRKPEHFQILFYSIKDYDQLEKVVDVMKELSLEGTLTATGTLSNAHRVLSMKKQFPEGLDKNQIISEEIVNNFKKEFMRGAIWVGEDAILSPTRRLGKAKAKRVKEKLGSVVEDIVIIDNRNAKILSVFAKPIKAIFGINLNEIIYFYYNSLYLGKPMEKQLAICYWRSKKSVPENIDIDRDRCGVISHTPSVPFNGKHTRFVLEAMDRISRKYNLEPNLGLKYMSDRHLICVPQILYDRDHEGQDKNAMDCYNEMLNYLYENGYPPYRLGVQSMDKMFSTSKEYVDFVTSLKESIDPNNILSPGHYGIKSK